MIDSNACPIDNKENLNDRIKTRLKDIKSELKFFNDSWNNALDKIRN